MVRKDIYNKYNNNITEKSRRGQTKKMTSYIIWAIHSINKSFHLILKNLTHTITAITPIPR